MSYSFIPIIPTPNEVFSNFVYWMDRSPISLIGGISISFIILFFLFRKMGGCDTNAGDSDVKKQSKYKIMFFLLGVAIVALSIHYGFKMAKSGNYWLLIFDAVVGTFLSILFVAEDEKRNIEEPEEMHYEQRKGKR